MKIKFMFENFEEFADIRGINLSHPSYEAFKIVWHMSRLRAAPSEASITDEEFEAAAEESRENPYRRGV